MAMPDPRDGRDVGEPHRRPEARATTRGSNARRCSHSAGTHRALPSSSAAKRPRAETAWKRESRMTSSPTEIKAGIKPNGQTYGRRGADATPITHPAGDSREGNRLQAGIPKWRERDSTEATTIYSRA